MSMETTNIVASEGFDAVMPQFDPPRLPGISIELTCSGGVKSPSLIAPSTTAFHRSRSRGLRI